MVPRGQVREAPAMVIRVRTAFRAAACAVLAALALHGQQQPAPAADRPNVVLVFCDDLGYGDLGCQGGKDAATPVLDRLAADGTRFTDFCVAQAVCGASRAALLTGCYPNRINLLGAPNHTQQHGLALEETTLAEVLRARGYATCIVGKWHLGHVEPYLPTSQGFDAWFGLPYSNDMAPTEGGRKSSYPPLPLFDGTKVVETQPDMATLTTRYTERAVQFIERHARSGEKATEPPFFLYLAHAMPHVPLGVHPDRKGKARTPYGDVVQELDWSMGELLRALERTGNAANTLVLFTSDNGPWLPYGNHAGSTGGLRGAKGTTFEGGVRVPCIAWWPGRVPAGRVEPSFWSTLDVLPTLAALAGAKLPELPIDGLDASALLLGKGPSPRTTMCYWWGRELQAVRMGSHKLHFPHAYRTLEGPAGKDGGRVPDGTGRIGLALFDLAEDPGEQIDLAAARPEVVARLQEFAGTARSALGDTATKVRGTELRNLPAEDAAGRKQR